MKNTKVYRTIFSEPDGLYLDWSEYMLAFFS